jgi:hypothetical protein
MVRYLPQLVLRNTDLGSCNPYSHLNVEVEFMCTDGCFCSAFDRLLHLRGDANKKWVLS